MSKIGRNDVCPCGSGKKYKNCCLHKTDTDNNLFKITIYGSEYYERNELDMFDSFFIKTSANENFEVKKAITGFTLIDIDPPVYTMQIKDYNTTQFNDIQFQKLIRPNPSYNQIDIGKHGVFNGISKGGHFSWYRPEGNTTSKGKIEKLYVKQVIGNTTLNIHLFPPEESHKTIEEFKDNGFSIITETDKYDFKREDKILTFEDSKVIAVLSLIDMTEAPNDVFNLLSGEHNVSLDIILNKPFLVIKVHEDRLKLSFINDKVIDIVSFK